MPTSVNESPARIRARKNEAAYRERNREDINIKQIAKREESRQLLSPPLKENEPTPPKGDDPKEWEKYRKLLALYKKQWSDYLDKTVGTENGARRSVRALNVSHEGKTLEDKERDPRTDREHPKTATQVVRGQKATDYPASKAVQRAETPNQYLYRFGKDYDYAVVLRGKGGEGAMPARKFDSEEKSKELFSSILSQLYEIDKFYNSMDQTVNNETSNHYEGFTSEELDEMRKIRSYRN
jgi:hypothetical protein